MRNLLHRNGIETAGDAALAVAWLAGCAVLVALWLGMIP